MVSITVNVPIPEVDELQRELDGANRVIKTLGGDKARLQHEVINLQEGRIAEGRGTFSDASYYALRSRFKAVMRENKALAERLRALERNVSCPCNLSGRGPCSSCGKAPAEACYKNILRRCCPSCSHDICEYHR